MRKNACCWQLSSYLDAISSLDWSRSVDGKRTSVIVITIKAHPPQKGGGVALVLGYLHRIRLISEAVLRIKIYDRAAKGLPEDVEELGRQIYWLSNCQNPFVEMQFHSLRGCSRDELLRKITKCREEVLKDENLYEDLLTEFGMKPFDTLRPRYRFAETTKPRKLLSPWKQLIFLALKQLGIDSHYMSVAHWIADIHPHAVLPTYCNEFKDVSRDIGWLAANYKTVAKGVMRDVSRVRIGMVD